jgi:hypothetical protein
VDAINLLANVVLPTSSGAPAVPLQPGQIVQALVLELLQSGAFRLQLPQAVVDVRSTVPLTPGDTITLAAKGNGSALRLDILGQGTSAPRAGLPADPAAAQAVRRPIGEAVIIARLNVPDAAPGPTKTAPVAAPAPDVTPPRALADAVRSAAARQGGLAPLLADVEQAAKIATLPAPVRAAVTQLLGLRLPLTETLTAADVKQAFMRSGVLLEPKLAAAAQAPPGVPTAAEAAPDLKATLLVLRQALKAWAGESPQPAPAAATLASATLARTTIASSTTASNTTASNTIASVALSDATLTKLEPLAALAASASPPLTPEEAESIAKTIASALLAKAAGPQSPTQAASSINPPPPYRGAPLTPQPPTPAAIADDLAPRAVADKLIAGTDAALSRQTLLQAASLPDAASLDAPRDANPRWTFEVPFATPQGTGIVPFEIARDGRGAPAEAQGASWRARFSLDLEPMGPVHALVTLSGDRASVTLWAERISTASKLNDNVALLGDALRAAELQPNELSFRVGTPRAAKAAAPGRFMDRAS